MSRSNTIVLQTPSLDNVCRRQIVSIYNLMRNEQIPQQLINSITTLRRAATLLNVRGCACCGPGTALIDRTAYEYKFP